MLTRGQYSFESNSDSTSIDLGFENSTNAIFSFKLLESNTGGLFSIYFELTLHNDSAWSYKRILISHITDEIIKLPELDTVPNIGRLWNSLVDLGILTLKPENESRPKTITNGMIFEFSDEQYDKMEPLKGANMFFEFFNNEGIRAINYYAPERKLKGFRNSKLIWYMPELERTIFYYKTISKAFKFEDFSTSFKEYFSSQKSSSKKKRR